MVVGVVGVVANEKLFYFSFDFQQVFYIISSKVRNEKLLIYDCNI